MRRTSRAGLILVVLIFSLPLHAQDVDEIIEKNIEARGGYEILKSINTIKSTGKILQMGLEMPMTIYQVRPTKQRFEVEVQGQTVIQVFDGEKGWSINPMAGSTDPQPASEEDNQQAKEAFFDGYLMDYKDNGSTVELVGTEDLEGTEVYKLKITLKSGRTVYEWLDKEYFIELKTTTTTTRGGQEFEVDLFYSDYKEVEGTMIPHSIEQKVGGNTYFQMKIDTVAYNVEIDGSIFKMPEKEEQ